MLLLIITYLAGALTILSPCILPVLPFVFSKSQGPFVKSGLPLLSGMIVTFSLFSVLALVGGEWIIQANAFGRNLALGLFLFFGISLIFPVLIEKLIHPLVNFGQGLGQKKSDSELRNSFLTGVGTGLLWAPCAGPILGLVLAGAASQKNISQSLLLLVSYSLGSATSLGLALFAGKKVFSKMKQFLGWDQIIKKSLGVMVILGVIAIYFNLDRTLLTEVSKIETSSLETRLLEIAGLKKNKDIKNNTALKSELLVEGIMPELVGAVSWINSKPLTKADLKGKVVLIDFWTYSCINCLRTLPYVKAWAEKYKNTDLVILGIHTPEFGFEKIESNVQKAVTDLGITYPVALDNDYQIWTAFKNEYWPAHYFIDRQGQIRAHHFGEGHYEESEKIIQQLLSENGENVVKNEIQINQQGVHAPRTQQDNLSPETYLGYDRMEKFSSTVAVVKDKSSIYKIQNQLKLNEWAIEGQWLIDSESIILKSKTGKINFKYFARDLHLVLGTKNSNKKIKYKIKIDGKAPLENRGSDVDSQGMGLIDGQRLYQLIRHSDEGDFKEHVFEIEFLDSEAQAFAFTFG